MQSAETTTQLTADPARVAWLHSHEETLPALDKDGQVCGRCNTQVSRIVDYQDVFSSFFTAWDNLDPTATGLCIPCSWAYGDASFRTSSLLVSSELFSVLANDELQEILSKPLPSHISVTVPLAGKKHLLPEAQWGTVVTDQGVLPWGKPEAELFVKIMQARDMGANEKDLSEQVPDVKLFLRLTPLQSVTVLQLWDFFLTWRGTPQWQVAIKASRLKKLQLPIDTSTTEGDMDA